jgi:hypothetical protein
VKRTLQTHQNPATLFRASDWVGYLGLAFGLSGCGGLQRSEFASDPL